MSLKQRTASGFKWTAFATAAGNVIDFAVRAVLARLLLPGDFGLAGMTMVVISFAQPYVDVGIGKAVIQRQESTDRQLSSLYWLNVSSGFAIFLLSVLLTPAIAGLFGDDRLRGLVPWMAVSFLIAPFGQLYRALLQRDLHFDTIAKIETAAGLVGGAVGVGAAIAGQGVFSFVWKYLAGIAVSALSMVVAGARNWRPKLYFRWAEISGYLSFGLFHMGQAGISRVAAQIDYIVIGRFLGAEPLGIYWLARQLVLTPLTKITPVLTQVLFPVFAKLQYDRPQLRNYFLEVSKALTYLILPILAILGVTADLVIPVFFGPGWEGAIPLVWLMVPVAMFRLLGVPFGAALLATGRPGFLLWWRLSIATLSGFAFVAVVHEGLVAVARWAFILGVIFFLIRTWLHRYFVNTGLAPYARTIAPGTAVTAVATLTVFVSRPWLTGIFPNQPIELAAAALVAGVVIVGTTLTFRRKDIRRAWEFIRPAAALDPAAVD